MKLMTKAIEKKAQAQYPLGDSMNQKVVAKFFNPVGSWSWFLMNQDPTNPDYMWGIVNGFDVEIGSFSLSELQNHHGRFGLGIERDKFFKEMPAKEVLEKLNNGERV